MTHSVFFRRLAFIVTVISLTILPVVAKAAITQWQDLGGGRVRLVVIYDPIERKIDGIIDVELKPGWVTYWRNPGESGIPPIFDFSKSAGVAVQQPHYPAPKAQYKAGLTSYVYTERVSFPFSGTPLISPISGTMQLDLIMGVCKEICNPASVSIKQDLAALNRTDLISTQLIQQAWAKIPTTDSSNSKLPQILGATRQSETKISIKVKVPHSAQKLELFAESEYAWFFNPAELNSRDGDKVDFLLDIGGLPKSADLTKTPLRFTLSADGVSSEKSLIVQ